MQSSFLLGLLFYMLAFTFSIITIFLCFKVVMRITKYNDLALIKENNAAAAIVIASSFIAMAFLVKNAIYPASAVIQDYWFLADKVPIDLTLLILRVCGYLLLTVIISLFSISSALKTFQWLTRDMDEELEIRRNNVAVAVLLGGVLVAFAIMIETGISDFVNALIPMKNLIR